MKELRKIEELPTLDNNLNMDVRGIMVDRFYVDFNEICTKIMTCKKREQNGVTIGIYEDFKRNK